MYTWLVIETYKPGQTAAIYERFTRQGRMLPAGVEYVNSWVEVNLQKCYQIMRGESLEKLHQWIARWNDLVDFEVIPVLSSEEAARQAAAV